MKSALLVVLFGLTASIANAANDWVNMLVQDPTGGLSTSHVCYSTNGHDVSCDNNAPSVIGTLLVVSSTNVSLTTAGTTWGYLNSTRSYVPVISTTNTGVSNVLGFDGQPVTAIAGGGGNYIVSGSASVSTTGKNGGVISIGTGSGPVMTISGSNVGVGNVNPIAKLDVSGTTAVDTIQFSDGTTQTSAGTASATANGYQKLPSGIIMEWGSVAACGSGCFDVISFPLAFPHNVFSVTTTIDTTSAVSAGVYVTGVTTSGANLDTNAGGATKYGAYWMAIGN
jgi:hypothetical protein